MACARQTLLLKGEAVWHFFTFFFLFGEENWHKRKTLPWIKEKACSSWGHHGCKTWAALGGDCVIPTQSINIRLCRGKVGKEVLGMSQFQGQSDQAMTRGVHIRNGGLKRSCARPTVRGWERGETPWYIPGCFLDLNKPRLSLVSSLCLRKCGNCG